VAALMAAFTVAHCVRQRSFRPGIFVTGVCLTNVALTVVTKTVVGRPDPHGLLATDYGGSFPSGHMTSVFVCFGLAVLLARSSAGRWVWLVPALAGGLMGTALLLQAAHWLTDLVGGGLLAICVLAVATASGWSRWLHGQFGKDLGGKQ
jgi:membrane-associated phospholipid phosphatase